MRPEQRNVYYDQDLEIEAYNLKGVVQKFPNHFHEFYVIGFIEGGKRQLWCKGKEYALAAGDLVLFNPRDNHYCAPVGGESLDYRAVNISVKAMQKAAQEITGRQYQPYFMQNVVHQSGITQLLSELYQAILTRAPKMEKEEALFFLLEHVLQRYSLPFEEADILEPDLQIKNLCSYMEEHFSEHITLDEQLFMTSFGKSYLLRSFIRQIGVSPYRYLQTVRLEKAKKFLEEGITPVQAAVMAGFADQSHFTNSFKSFTGFTPKQYQKSFGFSQKANAIKKGGPSR